MGGNKPTSNERFDRLEEKLFGTETIDPGILVRMDARLTALEGNPLVVAGQSARNLFATIVALSGVLYFATQIQNITHWVRHH